MCNAPTPLTLKEQLISSDTEFPGVVARPLGEFRSNNDYMYQLIKVNVDMLKIIQLGKSACSEFIKFLKSLRYVVA